MVVTGAILFLLGTIDAFATANPVKPTEIIIEKHTEPKFADKLINYGLPGYPPFISNFMEHGTNVFFNPQITLSPVFATGHEVIFGKDCNKLPMAPAVPFAATPEFIIEEPVKIIETNMLPGAETPTVDKVVVIKPPSPVKPGLSDPQLIISPLPAVTEELIEVPVSNPILHPDLPPLPIIPEPINDVFQPAVIEEVKPVFIPDAPELPPLSVPEVPSFPAAPVPKPVSLIEQYDNTMSLHVPEAPELPPYLPPKLPLPVVMTEVLIECDKKNKTQQTPILIESQPSVIEDVEPMIIPLPPAEILVSQPILEKKPVDIPPAPVLPEFHAPLLPPMAPVPLPITAVVSEPIAESPEMHPMDETKPLLIEEHRFESMEIPQAPILPPMAPVSIVMTEPVATAPELPEVMTNEITIVEVPGYVKPVPNPEAPLSTLAVAEEISIQKETLNIPVAPEFSPLLSPSVPFLMEQTMPALYSPAELTPLFIEETKLPLPLDNRPQFMTFAQPAKLPLSEVESIISFPTSCVQNIVTERVLPNIVRERKVEVFSSSNYPVLPTYLPTIGIKLFQG